MSSKSLLFANPPVLPFGVPPGCTPCRTEVKSVIRKFGRLYTLTLRDKIAIEDPYLNMVKAEAFALQQGEPFAGLTPDRSFRDVLIKSNLVI
jgi:hypothetical protein